MGLARLARVDGAGALLRADLVAAAQRVGLAGAARRRRRRCPELHLLFGRVRQAAPQPAVAEGHGRGHALLRVPLQAPPHEVHEVRVPPALEGDEQLLGAGRPPGLAPPRLTRAHADGAVGVDGDPAVAREALDGGVEEVLGALARLDELGRRHAPELHDAGQLVALVLARQQGKARHQLGQDAAQAPHVDGHAVARAQDHFRRTVEARLDVRVHPLRLVAAGPEVDHLYATHVIVLVHYAFSHGHGRIPVVDLRFRRSKLPFRAESPPKTTPHFFLQKKGNIYRPDCPI